MAQLSDDLVKLHAVMTSEFVEVQNALAGEFSLERELGRGGMGIVYLAREIQLERSVAIKVLPDRLAKTPLLRERFIREARTAASLSHPHIVPVHRVGEAGGFVFFVMAYVPGQTLGDLLRTAGPLPQAVVARLMREVAWALAYAHGNGVVHRDIKPDNILIEQGTGRALVADFGIASVHGGEDVAEARGTRHFMSPEQAAGATTDGRSDLYSLGVVAYLAVTGRLPHLPPPDAHALLGPWDAAVGVDKRRMSRVLSMAIEGCLASDPDKRFSAAAMLVTALAPQERHEGFMPTALRTWLAARNSLEPVLLLASGFFAYWLVHFATSEPMAFNDLKSLELVKPDGWGMTTWTAAAIGFVAPLASVVGYHIVHARRLFRAGYALSDLREALLWDAEQSAEVERETNTLHSLVRRVLGWGTIAIGSASAALAAMLTMPTSMPYWTSSVFEASAVGTLLAACAWSVAGVHSRPRFLRVTRALRDGLWMSNTGRVVARWLGAPRMSKVGHEAIDRRTENALGLAANELFAALPDIYRQQLQDLPRIVTQLEARATEARTRLNELESVSVVESTASDGVSAARRALATTTAALERLRLVLVRLHAGSAPAGALTTLLEEVSDVGATAQRLVDAQREVDGEFRFASRQLEHNPTPA